MKQYYLEMVRVAERYYESVRRRTITDSEHPFFGGYPDPYDICEVNTCDGIIDVLVCAYCAPESRYHHDPEVLEHLDNACGFTLSNTNDDSTMNLLITDFHTAATFDLLGLVRSYRILEKYGCKSEAELQSSAMLFAVIERHARGLLATGFRTPNHRWMEAASLFMTYNLLGWPELNAKARKYVAEGIDIDEYGEFTERSPGMYNAVNDNALLTMAEDGNLPELYPLVKKNMDLLFDYIEGDGTIFTQNSRRKDKGEGSAASKWYPCSPYCFLYLWAGVVLKEKRYLKFAHTMLEENRAMGSPMPNNILWVFLLHPELMEMDFQKEIEGVTLPTTYRAFYPLSNIYRRRQEYFSYSIIANNPNFLFVKCGDLMVYVRMCASFFAKAQFVPDCVEKTDDGYRLRIHATDDYKLPLETPPETSDYLKMDHSKRKHVQLCELTMTVDFTETENGVKMHVYTDSNCEPIPFKMEFVVLPNCRVETDHFATDAHAGEYVVIKNEAVRLERFGSGHTIVIKGLKAKHRYHTNMRGSVPQVKTAYTIYSTEYCPVDSEFEIVCGRNTSATTLEQPIV
ncbi:MAG: hypothetical protein IJC25_03090 [Clostridia bacterium]|nr:hypothetical protein [Clostridia bacterium]